MNNQKFKTFFSLEKNEDIKKIKEDNVKIIKIFNDVNDFSYKIINNFNGIKIEDGDEFLFSSFIELTKYYQSSVIMLEYGLIKSFECILRCIIDLVIKMKFVLNDNANVERLKKSMYIDLEKKLNYIKSNCYFDIISKKYINDWLKISNKELIELNKKNIKSAPDIKKMCEDVNLKKEYVYYGLESDYIHNNFSVIMGNNKHINNDIFLSIDGSYDNFKESGYRLLVIMELIIPYIVERFVPSLNEECLELFKKSAENYQKEMEDKND